MSSHFESNNIQVKALLISDYSSSYSHWRAEKSLSQWLWENHVPALSGIDTRALTRKLREKGSMLGKIDFKGENVDFYNPNEDNLYYTRNGQFIIATWDGIENEPAMLSVHFPISYNLAGIVDITGKNESPTTLRIEEIVQVADPILRIKYKGVLKGIILITIPHNTNHLPRFIDPVYFAVRKAGRHGDLYRIG
ncbi:MAG: carbamoyl-phosphate synthase domain-containing protein [Deltaproteobacteria bacterium]